MGERYKHYLKYILSGIFGLLAIIYWMDVLSAQDRIDDTFLILAGAAVIIAIIPWEWITSLKAGPIELIVERPQVKSILGKLQLRNIESETIKNFLNLNSTVIIGLQGSRILWIDDRPEEIVGERRLLRALGFEIVTAISSEEAQSLLFMNPDFDLIISDVQRAGDSYRYNDGVDIHEGVNFVVKLQMAGPEEIDLPFDLIRDLPVVFYAAYDWPRLEKFTRPAREVKSDVEICNNLNELIVKIVNKLNEVYSRPVQYPVIKKPTYTRE